MIGSKSKTEKTVSIKADNKPKIGEIWIVTIPIVFYDGEDVLVNLQKRPVLVLDDGRGLIVEADKRNFHVFKLTTQDDPYKRKLIKDWKKLGLLRKSYIRIELPHKIEPQQFNRKICEVPVEFLKEMYSELYSLLNIKALEKIANEEK